MVFSCSLSVLTARSAAPLLLELYFGLFSTSSLSGNFSFARVATAMIAGSLSQRSLQRPT